MYTCSTCKWLKTFKPRQDEIERFGWLDLGYACSYPNYEGYTDPLRSCSFYKFKVYEYYKDLECTTPATEVGDIVAVARIPYELVFNKAADRPCLGTDEHGTYLTWEGKDDI